MVSRQDDLERSFPPSRSPQHPETHVPVGGAPTPIEDRGPLPVALGDQRRHDTDGTTPQEPGNSVNDFSPLLVHENVGYVQQNQPGVILPIEWEGARPLAGFTPSPVRTRVPAPEVLVPGTETLAKYDVLVGWDTEYVERVNPDGEHNEIISYQFSAVWRDRRDRDAYWLVEDVLYPPQAGQRLNLAGFVGLVLRTCGIGYRRAGTCQVLLVAHFGVAEWAALRDRMQIARKHLKDIRGVPVSFSSFKLTVGFGSNNYARVPVTLRDTHLLAPADMRSLDAVGRVTTFKKVDIAQNDKVAMDTFLNRDPVAFEVYAINDCRVALEYYLGFMQAYEAMFGVSQKLPLTLGDATVHAYLRWLDQHSILTRAGVLGKETRKITNQRGWDSKATVNVSSRQFTEALASAAYRGALSQAYEHGQTCVGPEEVILDLDFAGAYPAAMAVLPVIDWAEPVVAVTGLTEIVDGLQPITGSDQGGTVPIMFIECTFTFPPDCLYPCLPVPSRHGLVYPLQGTTTCTGIEIALARQMGAQITIKHGASFPASSGLSGAPLLAFAEFLAELAQRRAKELRDSLRNRLLKEMANSFYGKLAQGLTERQVYNFSSESKSIPASPVTVPHYAAMTTGIVRAALAALVAEIGTRNGCRVLSATTDGAMVVVPRRFTLEVDCKGPIKPPASFVALYPDIYAALMQAPPIQALEQGRQNMRLEPGAWLVIKHLGTEAWTFKTRGYILRHAGVDQHKAWSGYRPRSGDEMIEIYSDPAKREATITRLTTMREILEGSAGDLVGVEVSKVASLDYDYKRIPLLDDSGRTRPPDTVEDVDRQRQAAKTLHKDTPQKAAQRATPEAVAMRVQGLTMRGGTEKTIRRQVLRAIVQDIGQWRPPGMTDKEIAERLEVSGDTVKNQKRQPFNPLPDTSQVREIMAEMAGKLGLTLTEEQLNTLLNQAG